jgi:hypothetical protein
MIIREGRDLLVATETRHDADRSRHLLRRETAI